MTIQEILAHRKAVENLPEREKEILRLARKAVNAMGFALQNAHSEGIVMKYEVQSDQAMNELIDLLLRK